MPVTVRFAPSPTGRLHVGNIRTALLNWLLVARQGGRFILRLDDTDQERSTPEFAQGIRDDLTWLGLTWHAEARQSARLERYGEVMRQLIDAGRLYPCYEAEDELDRRRKRQLARGLPPIYDRSALSLTADERARLEAEGRRPHWRFRLLNTQDPRHLAPVPTLVTWNDLIRGDQVVDVGSLSDPVLVRADGTPLYTFCSVVDDIDMGVSHVVRGEDHVTNTGVQIQIFEALGAVPPRFAHHSLLVSAEGQALSKRLGALSIAALREAGVEPMAVASYVALLGTPEAIAPYATLAELAGHVEVERVSRAPGRYDAAELLAINGKLLRMLPHAAVAERLAALGTGGGAAFWEAVRDNVTVFADVQGWWQVVAGPVTPVIENPQLLAEAVSLVPPEPWDGGTWQVWCDAVKTATGAKGRALFHPLRLALTGRETGPQLAALLPLIGRARALERLSGRAA